MSPTEFSNYIKQRALQQQAAGGGGRSLSPGGEPPCYFPGAAYPPPYPHPHPHPRYGPEAPPPPPAPPRYQGPPPPEQLWAPPADLAPRYQPLLLAN